MENQQRPIIANRFDNLRLGLSQKTARRFVPRKWLGLMAEGIIPSEPLFSSQEEAKKYIEDKITQRRETFSKEYQKNFRGTALLTYEPALDREVYKELRKHKDVHGQAYQETLRGLNTYTRFQVETFIGERLNVGLSRWQYDLRPNEEGQGILYGHQMEEPILEMFSRGKETRNVIGEDVDRPRQTAEITQFEKIQEVMGSPEAAVGTTIISFTPPGKEGSVYSSNFYDVFILKEDATKKRYVEARRYASGLSIEDSLKKSDMLQPGYTQALKPEEEHVDAFLIAHPIVLQEDHTFFDKPDELHKNLQGDPKAMSYEDFQKKVVQDKTFSDMVNFYLQTLEDRPEDTVVLHQTLNAIMNRADEAAGLRPTVAFRRNPYDEGPHPRPLLPIIAEINRYGMHQVRETSTGCGSSGGFGQESSRYSGYGTNRLPSNMSPKKSSDVASGEDKYGKRTFECPDCHQTNYRPYEELLPACQHCGSTKVAC